MAAQEALNAVERTLGAATNSLGVTVPEGNVKVVGFRVGYKTLLFVGLVVATLVILGVAGVFSPSSSGSSVPAAAHVNGTALKPGEFFRAFVGPGDTLRLASDTPVTWEFSTDGGNTWALVGQTSVNAPLQYPIADNVYAPDAHMRARENPQLQFTVSVVPVIVLTNVTSSTPQLVRGGKLTLMWTCKFTGVNASHMKLAYRGDGTAAWTEVNSGVTWSPNQMDWAVPSGFSLSQCFLRLATTNLASAATGRGELQVVSPLYTVVDSNNVGSTGNAGTGYFGVFNVRAANGTADVYGKFVPGQSVILNLNLGGAAPATLPPLTWKYTVTTALSAGDLQYITFSPTQQIDRYNYGWKIPNTLSGNSTTDLRLYVMVTDGTYEKTTSTTIVQKLSLSTGPSINQNENVLRTTVPLGDPTSYLDPFVWRVSGTLYALDANGQRTDSLQVEHSPTRVTYSNSAYALEFRGASLGYTNTYYTMSNYRFYLTTTLGATLASDEMRGVYG